MKRASKITAYIGLVFFIILATFYVRWGLDDRNLYYMIAMAAICVKFVVQDRKEKSEQETDPVRKAALARSAKLIISSFIGFTVFIIVSMFYQSHVDHKIREQCNAMDVQACTAFIEKNSTDSVAYMKRGAGNIAAGNLDQGMKDLTISLSLRPGYTASLVLQGTVYLVRGQYSDAIHDFDRAALSVTPNSRKEEGAAIFWERGMAKFYWASPAAAIDDLAKAVQYNALGGEPVIWLHLARVRAGQQDAQEFEQNTAPLMSGKWPGPLIALYSGKETVEDVFVKAKSGTPSDQADQLCDANFYTAEWYLTQNQSAQARPLFQVAKDICPKADVEGMFAQKELAMSDKKAQ